MEEPKAPQYIWPTF